MSLNKQNCQITTQIYYKFINKYRLKKRAAIAKDRQSKKKETSQMHRTP